MKQTCSYSQISYLLLLLIKNINLRNQHGNLLNLSEELIRQIKEHGPQIIIGYFGKLNYQQAPLPFTTHEKEINHPIYFWKPKSERDIIIGIFHIVVIVGAGKETGQDLVYFIDPLDDSDPDQPEKRPLYVISYKRLRTDIANLDNIHYKSANDKEPKFFENTAYSIYKDPSSRC
jgi:hypothetical protein